MGNITPIRRSSLTIEVNVIPAGFLASLERRGLARDVRVVEERIEMTPSVEPALIVKACRGAGLQVLGFECDKRTVPGWSCERPASRSQDRLTSVRSSVWLPTFSAVPWPSNRR